MSDDLPFDKQLVVEVFVGLLILGIDGQLICVTFVVEFGDMTEAVYY